MRRALRIVAAAVVIFMGVTDAMATEETPYEVVKTSGMFELRAYAAHILAETVVEGDLESAGSTAFRRLFRYISGANRSQSSIAMTAPVSQQQAGEKIRMTAPVGQQRAGKKWAVSFTMPRGYTLKSLPTPDDPTIALRQVPPRRMAAVRYSGFWSESSYLEHKAQLESWMRENGLTASGDPVWARYNPPFTPWFMRRNEILIPVPAGDNK